MSNKTFIKTANKLGLPLKQKANPVEPVGVGRMEQASSDPWEVISIYQYAVQNGATWEDCEASAQYYYGMSYNALMTSAWYIIAVS